MALTGRYSVIDKAIMVTTGNTLVICGDTNAENINTSDMITVLGGTTRDYTNSGSSANMNILNDSTILYAELVWLSTVKSTMAGAIDVRSIQDNPITFVTPAGTHTITPDFTDSYTSPLGAIDRLRAKDITNIIKGSLSGTYSVENVPTSIPPIGLSEVRAGWALTVIYRNNAFPPKRIVYALGLEGATATNPIQATFTGFKTENDESSLRGEMITIFANGNVLDGNDTLKIGPSFANLTTIGNPVGVPSINPGTAPNNPWNSFASGQINIANTLSPNKGLIDISGTLGSINHNAFIPAQILGARNKWDITSVDISNTLIANQTQLAGQYTMNNPTGAIELVALGAQVNSMAPDIVATLSSYDVDGDDEYNINVGERVIYIVQIKNTGKSVANNVILSTTLNPALQFVPNTVTLNGVTMPGANITTSVNIGSIDPAGVANVGFAVKAVSLVQGGGTADTTVNYNYSFISGAGSPTYINYANTNTLKMIVQDGNLSVVKSVSPNTATIGNTLVYTTVVTNIGSENTFNMFFQDKINQYCSFVPGTLKIDGVVYNDYNPNDGFNLDDLLPNETRTIVFSVNVNTLTPNTVVENGALVNFSYIFNQYIVPIKKTIFSNTTSIQIQFSDIMGKRTADNYYPNTGDIVTYTLSLSNIGNVPAQNVQVLEPPVPGASFVEGSVYINGVRKLGYNPFIGFTIDSISPQTTTTVTYQVLINQIQPDQIIVNIAKVPFKYQITPGGPVISTEKDSNEVTTRTNYVIITIPETVDKNYATVNDILYYSINVTNTGNIDAINTTFLSAIQKETTFIPNTVAINGVIYSGYDPNLGFSLGTIPPENTINVAFQVRVNSVPSPNIIYNKSELVYSYKPDPNGAPVTTTLMSNTVETIINIAEFTINKYVDKAYALIGDYLVYKCIIANTGTVNLTNVFFSDEISTYVNFVPGTVYLNGLNYPDYNPNEGFSIGTVHPNDNIEIIFAVQVNIAPPFGYVINIGEMNYSYKVNPNSPIITETKKSNAVQTKIVNGNLSLTKTASLSYGTVGDTINYYLEISNNGNTTVTNAFFFDNIPIGADFVSGSVYVNGISKPTYNPVTGFDIGSLNVGQVVTLSFNAIITSIPTPNTITNKGSVNYQYVVDPNNPPITKTSTSNNVTTTVNKGSATLTKAVDKNYGTINDIITYTVTANNTGTVTLTNVNFTDLVATGAAFVPGSVVIDNISYPSYNPNNGFIVPNILSGGSSVIVFKATITNIPNPPQIDNTGSINYKYKINPSGQSYDGSAISNTVTTYINQSTVTNTKTVDKMYAQITDVLTYTSVIKNTGNVTIKNTNFIDIIAPECTFNHGSVTINGTSHETYDPSVGFTLGDIAPNGTVTVVFKVTVSQLPSQGYVINSSTLYYNYRINPQGPDIPGYATSNTVTTYIKSGTLTITKTSNRTYARLTDTVVYTFVVTNTGNTTLNNVYFQDTIQSQSSFLSGSVYVNGVNKPAYNPNDGFTLGNIEMGQYVTVYFKITVDTLPPQGILYNTGNVNYSYYVDPSGLPIVKNVPSNETTVIINDAIITATKTVDKTIAKLGDILNFSIDIYNAGTVAAKFVTFTDLLDSNIQFNTGTVTINGTSYSNYNPNDGFPIDDILAGTTTTVAFAATIITRPSDNIVKNFSIIDYKYKINPSDPYIEVTTETNITTTYVATAELTLNKTVDKEYATVGDTLTYTINVKNTGSVNATNLQFKDTDPISTSFKTGTVVVDGILKPTFNPNTGFSLSDLTPLQYHVITFDVSVNSLPISGNVENRAQTIFDYRLLPTDPISSMTSYSNKVITYINLGKLNLTKSVDKLYATIGDVLSYSISINNAGNVSCTNVFFQDAIQSEGTFLLQSVKVNGISKPSFNPNTGFNLDDIPSGATTTVTFTVTVNALPIDYYIRNTASTTYNYIINPNNPPVSTSSTSNTVATDIIVGKLAVNKAVNKAYATIDDIVSYTVTVSNIGNTDAKFVNFRDVIPMGLTFIPNTVSINGVIQPGFNPYQSFTLGTMTPGTSNIVKFDTKVTSIPNPSLVTNISNIVFSYKINPNEDYIVSETDSNPVTTEINIGKLTLTKSVDKAYATIGDILTYTINVSNTGNVDVTNVTFSDGIQMEGTFVPQSVTVNGESKPDYNPQVGFNLGTIPTLGNVVITFKITVNALPVEHSIINTALATFSYKINPSGETYSKSTQSNAVSTIIIVAALTATKTVNLAYATINDILSYTITIKNTGNVVETSMFFIDTLSSGGAFIDGTVTIDGVSKPNLNPINGFALPDLVVGNTTVVTFNAKVMFLPSPAQVTNYANANGVYKIDPLGPDYPISAQSNTVTTQINVGNLNNVKSVDKMYAKVGDTITYTSTITNVGNVTAINSWFFDSLQPEVQFIIGTVRINSIVYPALDPTIGFSLGDLIVNQVIVIAFDVKINALPVPPQVNNKSQAQFSYKIDPNGNLITKTIFSNNVITNVVMGQITVDKTVDKTIATIGDVLTFNINITNIGNVIANEVFFQDTPSTGAVFNLGSVIVNGTPQPTFNPTEGFTVGNIGIGNVVTVQFTATVVSVPPTNKVTNQGVINFKYLVDPKEPPVNATIYSNTTTTNIALGSLSVTKAVNKQYATKGETLTYTIVITNVGNINATNVVFLDPTPANSLFVIGSVKINGTSYPNYNPAVGFDLNTMTPGQIITVVYQVQVI